LESISIPKSVSIIEYGAFEGCKSLLHIDIPENLINIEDNVFCGTGLKGITIPDSVTSIGSRAFSNCKSLKKAVIPDSVSHIGERAFQGCESFYPNIPKTVNDVGKEAFYGCKSIIHGSDSYPDDYGKYTLEFIIDPQFDFVGFFSEGFADVEKDGYVGFIDKKGNKICDLKYSNSKRFSNGLARVRLHAETPYWSFLKTDGTLLNDKHYKTITSFQNGLAIVEEIIDKDKLNRHIIDTKGNLFKLDENLDPIVISDGLIKAAVKDEPVTVFLDLKGNEVFSFNRPSDDVLWFSEGLFCFKNDKGKYGFHNSDEAEVIPPIYDFSFEFIDGLAKVRLDNGNRSFINKQGELINDKGWNFCGDFHEGLCSVKDGRDHGFIDKNGEFQITIALPGLQDHWFSEGLCALEISEFEGPYGFINRAGVFVVQPQYGLLYNFSEGLGGAYTESGYGFVKNPLLS
jgi:hypothetical protein